MPRLADAVLALLLCASGPGSGQDIPPGQPFQRHGPWVASVGREMNTRMAAFRKAWARDAAARVARFYTADAMLVPPDGVPVRSREEILTFYESYLPTVGELFTSISDLDAGTTLAFAQGRFYLEPPTGRRRQRGDARPAERDGESPTTLSGTYLVVFRQEGRNWRIRFHIFQLQPLQTDRS